MIEEVIKKLEGMFTEEQLETIRETMELVVADCKTKANHTNVQLIDDFVKNKNFENCSANTIKLYVWSVKKLNSYIQKPFTEVTKKDIENFLIDYKNSGNVSSTSLNNMRRNISSFFNYLECEEIIMSNPVKKIRPIKTEKEIKVPYTEVEIDRIRHTDMSLCDKAIIDTLLSTGVRVSELVGMDIADIRDKEIIVRGKGNKERKVYFSDVAYSSVMAYLRTRTDNNKALFVTTKVYDGEPRRLCKDTVEKRLREMGDKLGIVMHPHKFRRTVATKCINKGMPIQEVKTLLGHNSIETTMIYCSVGEMNVKYDHHKYIA